MVDTQVSVLEILVVSVVHGGVIPFRGTTVAEFAALDGAGNVTAELGLDPETYAGWVDWVNPVTAE